MTKNKLERAESKARQDYKYLM
uniref:Uncharacterized protein n=1 Tax=Rhizophora mucronata TaxID=61149 RepID=A0A2P2Q0N5_RHIMU